MIRFPIGTIFRATRNSYTIKKGELVELIAYARVPKTGETIGQFKSCQSDNIGLLSINETTEINQ